MNVSFNQIVDWEKKLPKAVFYGTLRKDRQIFYDLAAKRPDLIEGKWNSGGEYLHPWNPASNESKLESEDPRLSKTANQSISDEEQEIGTLKNLLKVKINQGVPYIAANYKFVVVLTGDAGFSTSGRLSILLAHSGSVVLVQDHDMVYSFSSFLKPWVHHHHHHHHHYHYHHHYYYRHHYHHHHH